MKDIAAHVISYEALSLPAAFARILGARLRGRNPNDRAVEAMRNLSPGEVLRLYEKYPIPHGLTASFGGRIALTDGLIHHQDIRRSLGRPRVVPQQRVRYVLDFALKSPTIPARSNARALQLVAEDVDWDHGQGPVLCGNAEPLLIALAGRCDALSSLRGPGAKVLSARLERHRAG